MSEPLQDILDNRVLVLVLFVLVFSGQNLCEMAKRSDDCHVQGEVNARMDSELK
jgi:hypothetical protein